MKEEKNWLEWVVLGISALMIIGLIVFLGYLQVNNEITDPELEVGFKKDEMQKNKIVYHVTLKNNGGQTAEDVKIELVSWTGGKEQEKAELNFPFSPKKSAREGWVTFKTEPDSVSARVLGYLKP